jgi:hypothetical protein
MEQLLNIIDWLGIICGVYVAYKLIILYFKGNSKSHKRTSRRY